MEERKKLYRSIDERILGGVCGGIAEYFKVDPVLVRIIFIVLFFGAGSGLLAYLVAWIIVPEEPR
ncbi:PspC domain-containing protein [Halanaerobiaceae bacterium Z-7014]|uniref:PspC domain-containing protein n=1 Tax=Halonatronomonas betaini TaxID=2778430 RepID=A0A931AP63_9FIRM|nr:PspC domain-containing protein [Halonatronomonas betaini]MBF8436413.1 PspC domain-containing protein [Halonatronomonas betaini]